VNEDDETMVLAVVDQIVFDRFWRGGQRPLPGIETAVGRSLLDESHEKVAAIGLDLVKHVFQIHGIDATEKVVVRKQLRRCGCSLQASLW
jgi:hypothetical protein